MKGLGGDIFFFREGLGGLLGRLGGCELRVWKGTEISRMYCKSLTVSSGCRSGKKNISFCRVMVLVRRLWRFND